MLDMLKERKAALEAQGQKGFTLMEMLIVIAIIAILIAIAIPIFTSQLENARDATSIANIRSAYAEAQTVYITKQNDGTHAVYDADADTVTVDGVRIESQQANNWSGVATELPFEVEDGGTPGSATVVFTYSNGALSSVTYTLS
ncbi:MAG TPA: hypothetical protein DCP91_03140 [Eggerthellaceae bacterium]|nr:hypothetical protein [Eggerthellaceae bacterium]